MEIINKVQAAILNNPEFTLPFSYNLEENLKKINCLTQRQRDLYGEIKITSC